MGNVKWLESFRYMHTHRSPPQSTTDHEALANLSARCAYTTHACTHLTAGFISIELLVSPFVSFCCSLQKQRPSGYDIIFISGGLFTSYKNMATNGTEINNANFHKNSE